MLEFGADPYWVCSTMIIESSPQLAPTHLRLYRRAAIAVAGIALRIRARQ